MAERPRQIRSANRGITRGIRRETDKPYPQDRFEPFFKQLDANRPVLREGDRAVACKNAKTALAWLGFARQFGADPEVYDRQLSDAVMLFQKSIGHRSADGAIGPGTRSALVSTLLREFGAQRFSQLDTSEAVHIPTVFLSYAWADTMRVNKLDQWLRDHGIRVIRDVEAFKAGLKSRRTSGGLFSQPIRLSLFTPSRDWPRFEHQIAEQVESLLKAPVLIYLRLDDTPLRADDPHRIAIDARGRTLKETRLGDPTISRHTDRGFSL